MQLLRADIVNRDDEDGLVFLKEALELLKVSGLGLGPAPHVFLLELKIGYLRASVKNQKSTMDFSEEIDGWRRGIEFGRVRFRKFCGSPN